ncbi:MAG: ABC transporter substrate-binding protein [Acetobacteraceae bacterium]
MAQAAKTVLRVRPTFDLTAIDPLAALSTPGVEAAFMVFDCLYALDASLIPRPQMAAGHELSADGLAWRITLREGLFFHDGEMVRAGDATASIARWMQRDTMGRALKARMAELRVIDDRSFAIQLKRPFALVLDCLASLALFVLPARIAETYNAFTPIKEFIGSGPFVFLKDEWMTGSFAAFRRNDRYVPRDEPPSMLAGGKTVWVDRVEFHTIPDASVAASALRNGEIDVMFSPPIDLVSMLSRSRGVTVEHLDPTGVILSLTLNSKVPPLDNPMIRRALLIGISQTDCLTALGETAVPGAARVALFPPGTPMASRAGTDELTATGNLEVARRMVRESGYDGTRLPLLVATDVDELTTMGQVVHQTMKNIGLNVDYQATEFGSIMLRRNNAETPGVWGAYPSSVNTIAASAPGTNYALNGYGIPPDPRMTRSIEDWFDAPDLVEQKAAAERIQTRFLEAPTYIPLCQTFRAVAHRTNVTDIVPGYSLRCWGLRKA